MPPEFCPTQSFDNFASFDDQARLMLLTGAGVFVSYDDVLGYEYVEEHGKMGRGAVARAFSVVFSGEYVATAMKIRLLAAGDSPLELFIPFLITPVKSSSFIYRSLKESADAVMQKLSEICPDKTPADAAQKQGYIEEIRELNRLVDEGILTEDEFKAKKKQLLGL